ncbi:hypothetical protein ACFQUU_22690 [Herbaspirillum sp. GCM10030257]
MNHLTAMLNLEWLYMHFRLVSLKIAVFEAINRTLAMGAILNAAA